MKKHQYILLLLAVLVALTIALNTVSESQTGPVAYLGKEKITSSMLSVSSSAVEEQLATKLDRAPSSAELADAIADAVIQGIVDRVYEFTLSEAAEEFDIQITEEDQRQELSRIYGDDDQVLDTMTRVVEVLPKAWREAKANPEQEQQIYESQLKDLMSYDRWKQYLVYGAETIRRIEETSPPEKEDLYKIDESSRQVLVKQEVRKRVVRDVTVSEEKLLAAYKSGNYQVPFEQVRPSLFDQALRAEQESAWQEWMAERLAHAPVEIRDPNLKAEYNRYLQSLVKRDEQ